MTRHVALLLLVALAAGCVRGPAAVTKAQPGNSTKRPGLDPQLKGVAGIPDSGTSLTGGGTRPQPGATGTTGVKPPGGVGPTPPNGKPFQDVPGSNTVQLNFEELPGRWGIRPYLNRGRAGHTAGALKDRLVVAEGDHRPSFETLRAGASGWTLVDDYDTDWTTRSEKFRQDQGLHLAVGAVDVGGNEFWTTGGLRGGLLPDGRTGSTLFFIYRAERGFSRSMEENTGPYNLDVGRYAAAGGIVGSEFVVSGGTRGATSTVDVTEMVQVGGVPQASSRRGKPMPAPVVAGAASAVMAKKLFVAGGYTYNGSALNVVKKARSYDVEKDTWEDLPDLPVPLYGAAGAVLNGVFYVVGGFDADGKPLNSVYSFSLTAGDRWLTPPPMPTPRGQLAVAVFQNMLWAIGGIGTSRAALQTVETYQP